MATKIRVYRLYIAGSENAAFKDGEIFSGPGCIYDAARHLIAEGAPPSANLRVLRGDSVVLTGTIEAFALQMWGGAGRDPYSRPWRPSPWTQMPPLLAKWWESRA